MAQRNLQAEQDLLGQILKDKAFAEKFKAGDKNAIQQEINYRQYGTPQPVFEGDFNIPQLTRNATAINIGQFLAPSILRKKLQERVPAEKEQAAIGKAFEDIENPIVRRGLTRQSFQTSASKRDKTIDQALQALGAEVTLRQSQLQSAQDAFQKAQAESETRAQPFLAEKQRAADFEDYVNKALFQQGLDMEKITAQKKGTGSRGSVSELNELLTPSEAERFGVPYGTLKGQVVGQVTGTQTKSLEDFKKDILAVTPMSIEDNTLNDIYKQYREVQQIIDQNPGEFDTAINAPDNQLFAFLLKPRTLSDIDKIGQLFDLSTEE